MPNIIVEAGKDNWNQRTRQTLGLLKEQFADNEELSFADMSQGVSRKRAATCFFEILQLKTWDYIEIVQENPFTDIKILPSVSLLNTLIY